MNADIGAAASLAVLRSRLAGRGIHHGLADIDAAAIRLAAPRGFTREASRFVYECRTEGVEPLAGVRYQSRLDDGTSNWAISNEPRTHPHHCVRSVPNRSGLTIPTSCAHSPYSACK